mgnify:CR=1 FL=1
MAKLNIFMHCSLYAMCHDIFISHSMKTINETIEGFKRSHLSVYVVRSGFTLFVLNPTFEIYPRFNFVLNLKF